MGNGIIHFALIVICIGTMITSIMSVLTFLKVTAVHHATNGLVDQLKEGARKEGKDEGIAEEKQREADSH